MGAPTGPCCGALPLCLPAFSSYSRMKDEEKAICVLFLPCKLDANKWPWVLIHPSSRQDMSDMPTPEIYKTLLLPQYRQLERIL